MQVTTSANLVEYDALDDSGSVTAVLARSDVEAALEGDSPGFWFELGYEDEEESRLTIDLSPADLEAILGQTEGDEVVLALDGDWVSGVFEESDVEAHGLRLDPRTHAASCGTTAVDLTPTEFRILARLAGAPGGAIRRRELVRAAWPHGAIVHDNTLDVYIGRLRRKLAKLEGSPEITTVHGVGYTLR